MFIPLTTEQYETIILNLPTLIELDLSVYDLNLDDVERLSLAIAKHPQITSLNLSGRQLGDAGLQSLGRLTQLKKINLDANNLNDQGIVFLKQLPVLEAVSVNFNHLSDEGALAVVNLPRLQQLSLNGNDITGKWSITPVVAQQLHSLSLINNQINSFNVKLLSDFQALKNLYLDNNLLDDECIRSLTQLPLLQELSLSHNRLSVSGAELLAMHFQGDYVNLSHNTIGDQGANALANNNTLRKLKLSNCQLSDESVTGFKNNQTLFYLDLSYNQLSDKAMVVLASNQHLQHLNVTRNYFGLEGVKALANNQHLKTLVLKYNRLTDESVSVFRDNKFLQQLKLTGNSIGDTGAIAISAMQQLTTLAVSYNAIGDAGASALARHPSLMNLYLSYNQIHDLGASIFLGNTTLQCLCINYNFISANVRSELLNYFSTRKIYCSIEQPPDFSKENLSTIFLVSKGFFCILSQKGNIQFFNSSFSDAMGYKSEELLAQPLMQFIHPADKALLMTLFSKLLDEDVLLRLITKSNDLLIINWSFQWQKQRLYLTGTDLSFQKKADKLLTLFLQEEIKQTKMLAIQQANFIAHLCHEIRNPIGAVLSNVDVIFEHVQRLNEVIKTIDSTKVTGPIELVAVEQLKQESGLIENALADIKVCCRYAEGVLNDNLNASKLAEDKMALNKQGVDLRKIIDDIGFISKAKAEEKQLDLTINYDDSEEYWVKADELRLKQVLVNLVNNAIKFTKEGGIKASLRLLEQLESQNRFEICVKDTGIGLSPDEIARLFERYSQANLMIGSQYGGSGLGLHIAKHLAELMDGTINVTSKVNEGAEFSFMFAAERLSPSERMACIEDNMLNSPLRSIHSLFPSPVYKVLIVEDNVINSKALNFLLARMGHSTVIVDNGQKAVDYYCDHYQELDVILMDTFMPVMDGLEAIKWIRRFESAHALARKPIITLSGNAQDNDKGQAFEAGSDAYLTKPFKKESLCETMNHVIAQLRGVPACPPNTPVLASLPTPLPSLTLMRSSLATPRLPLVETAPSPTPRSMRNMRSPLLAPLALPSSASASAAPTRALNPALTPVSKSTPTR